MHTPQPQRARRLAAVIGLLAAVCTAAIADPAPWFYWKSVTTGERVCAQFTPGDGWNKDDGPYKDARCANRYR
jgi:hypothetical protein